MFSYGDAGAAPTQSSKVSVYLKGIFARCTTDNKDANIVIGSSVEEIQTELKAIGAALPTALTYSHLQAQQQSLPDVLFRYAIVYRQGHPVLFTYFQVYTLTASNFNLHRNTSFVKGIIGFFLDLKKARVLVLGNALRTEDSSYWFDTTQLHTTDALSAIATVAARLATDADVSATLMPGISSHTATHMQKLGYNMPMEDSVMELAIRPEWHTIAHYVAALSRKYRARAKKVLASATAQLTARQFTLADIDHHATDINRLFAQVIDKQSFVFTRSGAAYIAALKQVHGTAFELTGYFMQGQLVAFSSAFVTPTAYELYYVGFDTELNCECPLYFYMMLAGLERAIVLGKQTLKLGRTSFDAKASLGALPRQTDYLIKLRHIPDVAIKWFCSYFASIEDLRWKQRNPLTPGA